jgi:phospholipase C
MLNITSIFVLMLENHSFDNIFAMSGIAGIAAATSADSNSYGGSIYAVQSGAPVTMPTDPGHEFYDVFEQLAGPGVSFNPNQQYAPAILNSGFASNYATTRSEGSPPAAADIGKIMYCFDTPNQLPVIYQLATEFAICDHWFSSLPGPTWPNRFFVHGASSVGLDHSPTDTELAEWDTIDGFQYPSGSIYDALTKNGLRWRLYNDRTDANSDDPQSRFGELAQVASLKGIHLADVNSLSRFAADLRGSYPYHYTFIEPNYGDILANTYAGGSSQHPMDDVYGGESLIKMVYEAIRNSPIWNTSLLIITYDEHGGFYDSVRPGPAVAPGDVSEESRFNKYGFNFQQLGVRVPAVVVSPLIPAGTVDHTEYDHSSVPGTLESQFGFGSLTDRDKNAENVLHLLTLASPRTDCPERLADPAPPAPKPAAVPPALAAPAIDEQPLPSSGNLRGAIAIAAKTDFELSSGSDADKAAIVQKHDQIKTKGQARDYVNSVMQKLDAVRAGRR